MSVCTLKPDQGSDRVPPTRARKSPRGLPKLGWLLISGLIGLEVVRPNPAGGATSHPFPSALIEPGAKPAELHVDARLLRGATWNQRDQRLFFTAAGAEPEDTQILVRDNQGQVNLWLDKTLGVIGLTPSGRSQLLGAQSHTHCLVSYGVGKKGPRTTTVLLESSTFNQPNDLRQAPSGDIYFTDPDFVHRARSAVYLLRRSGELIKLITEMPLPNGLELSPDGRVLYVSDSQEKLWRRYPLMQNGVTSPGTVFFAPETEDQTPPDGMTVDAQGNLYLTGRGGIWVVDPEGTLLGLIPLTGACSSLAFGDDDGKSLFITCDHKLLRLRVKVPGAAWRSSH